MAHKTVGYLFGHPPDTRSKEADDLLIDSDTYLGIELELEDVHHLRMFQRFLTDNNWRWVQDHSLRGSSCELITSSSEGSPIRGMDIVTALEALDTAVNKSKGAYGSTPSVGIRCSTHIHVDVRDLTPSQISRFILYYVMFENILLKSEAPERVSNNYCLPVSRSADLKNSLVDLLSSGYSEHTLHDVVTQWPKYSALNVGAATNFGTIEFRIFPGSYDPKKILLWVNMILSLRRAAVAEALNIQEIPQTVSGVGLDKVMEKVFPKPIVDHLLETAEPRDMLRGARLIQSLLSRPHCRNPRRLRNKDGSYSNNFKAFQEMQGVK